MKNRFILFLTVLFLLMLISPAYSQEVPLNLQVKLALKIISMDRNFDRFGDPIKIGASSDEFFAELDALKGNLKIKGKAYVPEKMAVPDDVAKYKIIFVGKNWAGNYKAASEKAAENQCLMICEDDAAAKSGGGAVSFRVVGGKPKIVVNLNNMVAQGTEFPAAIIKMMVVVGK